MRADSAGALSLTCSGAQQHERRGSNSEPHTKTGPRGRRHDHNEQQRSAAKPASAPVADARRRSQVVTACSVRDVDVYSDSRCHHPQGSLTRTIASLLNPRAEALSALRMQTRCCCSFCIVAWSVHALPPIQSSSRVCSDGVAPLRCAPDAAQHHCASGCLAWSNSGSCRQQHRTSRCAEFCSVVDRAWKNNLDPRWLTLRSCHCCHCQLWPLCCCQSPPTLPIQSFIMRVSILFSLALLACSALRAAAVPTAPVFPLVRHTTHCTTEAPRRCSRPFLLFAAFATPSFVVVLCVCYHRLFRTCPIRSVFVAVACRA